MSDRLAELGGMFDFTAIDDHASRRHGLITGAELRAAGLSPRTISRWAANGRLRRVSRSVYKLPGAALTTEARMLAAVLSRPAGAVVSHRSAGWLWDLPGMGRPSRIDVTIPWGASGVDTGVVSVRRSRRLPVHHRTKQRGIPVTTMARTVVDLAAEMGPKPLDEVIEVALRSPHCSMSALSRAVHEIGTSGRAGTVRLRKLLARRGEEYVPTESRLDVLGRKALATVDGLEWQVEFSDEQGYIRRVDGFHRRSGLVIEWDGAEFHDRPGQRRLDASQDRRLEALGLTVMRFRWRSVTQDPAMVLDRVRGHIDRAAGTVKRSARP